MSASPPQVPLPVLTQTADAPPPGAVPVTQMPPAGFAPAGGPCVPLPSIPPFPSVPSPFSVVPPPLPRPPTTLLCCNLPPFPPAVAAMIAKYEAGLTVPLPPAPAELQAATTSLDSARIAINKWKDALPNTCPRQLQQVLTPGSSGT